MIPRRGLFWRVYLTLLASLVLAAVFAGALLHLIMQPGMHPFPHHRSLHMLALLVAIAGAVGLVAYPAVAMLTRRLERLRASVEAWGAGALATRAPVEGDDEVAAVAVTFNAAADKVQDLLAAHKDLLAHAGHELRSPIARLRLGVEMFARTGDPALRPDIVRDIEELSAIVEEILLASRLDQASAFDDQERLDWLGLAAEEASRAGVALREAKGGAFDVEGSPRLLRRLVRNLIENATRHGRPPVELELGREGGEITLTVDDAGPGIDEGDRERVFEPFYRPSGRPEAAGGWGLGLSIVRQIAKRHGGAVSCLARPGGGSRFLVTLPAARAS